MKLKSMSPMGPMGVRDINEWIHPPLDYLLVDTKAEGSFLRLEYRQIIYIPGTMIAQGRSIINIFVNDFGREVLRTCDVQIDDPAPLLTPQGPQPKPLNAWERVAFAFGLLVSSLKEALCR